MFVQRLDSFFASVNANSTCSTIALLKAFDEDENPSKVNLCIGAYRTEENRPFVLPVVKKTEATILANPHIHHEYLPTFGSPKFTKVVVEFLLGKNSPAIIDSRAHGIQALSGTGALRLGADFLSNILGFKRVYLSNPTWENHARIFDRAGFEEIKFYRYFNTKTRNVDIDGMLEDLENAPDRSLILLHACAHNPTGCDPTREQWISIANVVEKKEHLVFFDSAYQGFASGDVDEDAFAVRYFVARNIELLCAQSFSKIFGLYGERVGNLAVVHRDTSTMKSVMDQLTAIAYDMYLSPPEHGALVVQTVLSDENLYAEWLDNVKLMANRIKSIRKSLYAELVRLNTPGSWDHIIDQIGMFSYTGLNENQVQFIINKYHIYLRATGRISMSGVNERNVYYIATAMHEAVTTISN